MPTFDFQCLSCGATFEHTRPFGSASRPPCPRCASKRTEKRIAPPAIHFRGTGFYKTDHSATPPPETKKKGEGQATAGAKPEVKMDSKKEGK